MSKSFCSNFIGCERQPTIKCKGYILNEKSCFFRESNKVDCNHMFCKYHIVTIETPITRGISEHRVVCDVCFHEYRRKKQEIKDNEQRCIAVSFVFLFLVFVLVLVLGYIYKY